MDRDCRELSSRSREAILHGKRYLHSIACFTMTAGIFRKVRRGGPGSHAPRSHVPSVKLHRACTTSEKVLECRGSRLRKETGSTFGCMQAVLFLSSS